MSEAEGSREEARRVLQAAAVEAHGRPDAFVLRHRVMQRSGIVDPEDFRAVAEHLEEKGWIAEADEDYATFVVTTAGIDEASD